MSVIECKLYLDGQYVATINAAPPTKNGGRFTSGSRGYHGQAKLVIGSDYCQCQVQAVVIGSKYETTDEEVAAMEASVANREAAKANTHATVTTK